MVNDSNAPQGEQAIEAIVATAVKRNLRGRWRQ